jgi:uncharacterized Fe-S center protein
MTADVYFAQRRVAPRSSLLTKFGSMLDASGLANLIGQRDRVAIKIHFGEPGNTTTTPPALVRALIQKLHDLQARPFVVDTCSRSGGLRADAVGCLQAAATHGYLEANLGAPVLVADGFDGRDMLAVPCVGPHQHEVGVATAIARADALIVVNHVTLHPETGLGGVLQATGLGCLDRQSRLTLDLPTPALEPPPEAAEANWRRDNRVPVLQLHDRIAESAQAVVTRLSGKALFVNVLLQVTPDPDGVPWSDAAIIPDVGLLLSRDPVGIDQATAEFINAQAGAPDTRLADPLSRDKIRALVPDVDWQHLLRSAERLGMGQRQYELLIT